MSSQVDTCFPEPRSSSPCAVARLQPMQQTQHRPRADRSVTAIVRSVLLCVRAESLNSQPISHGFVPSNSPQTGCHGIIGLHPLNLSLITRQVSEVNFVSRSLCPQEAPRTTQVQASHSEDNRESGLNPDLMSVAVQRTANPSLSDGEIFFTLHPPRSRGAEEGSIAGVHGANDPPKNHGERFLSVVRGLPVHQSRS